MLESFETERTSGIMAIPQNESTILEILKDNLEQIQSLDNNVDIEQEAFSLANQTDLPPGGIRENHRNFLIQDKSTLEHIGVIGFHLGYPGENIFYIGTLFLSKRFQRKGFGREIITECEKIIFKDGYIEGRLGVELHNWGALRFWTAMGFDRITKIAGDDYFGEDKHAIIELAKKYDIH